MSLTSSKSKELYKIKTIASLTGFSTTLLRAWERRYRLLMPTRTATGHRLYTQEDLRVLKRVRTLLDQGRSIGEVVAQGRDRLLNSVEPESTPLTAEQTADLRRLVVDAALHLDERRLEQSLDETFARFTVLRALDQVVVPACHDIGRMWAQQQATVASEHLLSAAIEARLQKLLAAQARIGTGPQVLCCAFPDEFHELGVLTLQYYLLQLGMRVFYLGAALPFEEVERAVQERRPEFVMLSVARASLLDVHRSSLTQLVQRLPGVRFIVGGGGVMKDDDELLKLGVVLWPLDRPLTELSTLFHPS